jgi:hypothetical protein
MSPWLLALGVATTVALVRRALARMALVQRQGEVVPAQGGAGEATEVPERGGAGPGWGLEAGARLAL